MLLRPSGTEPLVRVMVEAPSEEEADGGLRAACRLSSAKSWPELRGRLPLVGLPMCGIVGYVGGRPCQDLLSPDSRSSSTGAMTRPGSRCIEDGRIENVRAVGNLANLRAAVAEQAESGGGVAVAAPAATTGVAHTRWATHGRVTEENAHPHSDSTDRVHIVLNGIVENHAELRRRAEAEGPATSAPRPTPRSSPT